MSHAGVHLTPSWRGHFCPALTPHVTVTVPCPQICGRVGSLQEAATGPAARGPRTAGGARLGAALLGVLSGSTAQHRPCGHR